MPLTRESIDNYCLSNRGATKDYPFGPSPTVYRVMGKMFALSNENNQPITFNLKCDPDWALALRDMYAAVQPGYHMNKRHWNSVTVDGSIPDDDLFEMIDHSYDVIVKKLPKRDRALLNGLDGKRS